MKGKAEEKLRLVKKIMFEWECAGVQVQCDPFVMLRALDAITIALSGRDYPEGVLMVRAAAKRVQSANAVKAQPAETPEESANI